MTLSNIMFDIEYVHENCRYVYTLVCLMSNIIWHVIFYKFYCKQPQNYIWFLQIFPPIIVGVGTNLSLCQLDHLLESKQLQT